MRTHTLIMGWASGGDNLSKSVVQTADGETNLDIAVPDSSTDLLVAFVADVSQMKSLFLLSDKDVTIETNSGSAADDTIDLKANVPVMWVDGGTLANPLTTDVTALYITNASGSAATVNLRMLIDSTP